MDEEYPAHRKALEEGGWLQGGEVIHYWVGDRSSYPISFYVAAYKGYTGKITIDCLRVFGGADEVPAQVSVDKSIRNWNRIFGE